MGLSETIQKFVQSGLKATGNLRKAATYQVAGTPVYNPTTGTPTVSTTTYAIEALFTSFSDREIDGDRIRPEDQKCLVAGLDLAVTPGKNDTILVGTAVWSVVEIRGIPSDGLWILQVRRP